MTKSLRPVTIAHISDVHLGLDYNPGLATRTFHLALAAVRRSHASALVIVGDLFDHNRVTPETVNLAVEGFRGLAIPVVVLPGNHDCLDETSVYRRVDLEALCPNLCIIKREEGELLHYPGLRLKLWGRPIVNHSPGFQPLSSVPARDGDWWHVALAHGIYTDDGNPTVRSSPISPEQIAAVGWDYVALGHHHLLEEVSQNGTRAWYCGSPMGPGYDNSTGHVLFVHFTPDQPTRVECCSLGAGR